MDEKILTPDQVALILQVHPFTVLKFIKQGKLRASKLGRVYRIRQSDVGRFLDEGEASSATVKEAAAHTSQTAPKAKTSKGSNHEEKLHDSENSDFAHSESKNNQQLGKPEPHPPVDHYILD